MDWEDIWTWLLFAVIVIGGSCGLYVILAPHNLTSYYLSEGGSHGLVCVYGHWTNKADEQVYCSTSPDQALAFLEEANKSLHPKITVVIPRDSNGWIKDIPEGQSLKENNNESLRLHDNHQ